MTAISFDQFVGSLPRGDQPVAESFPDGVQYQRKLNPAFVPPTLRREVDPGTNGVSVVLVAAAAATGKTTLAEATAQRTGALFWNLAALRVGTGTFAGTIQASFPVANPDVMGRIARGEFLVILDALDEAAVSAGASNFDAFLKDLIRILIPPRPRPAVILFARNDTADSVQLIFEEAGVTFTRYSVDFFNWVQAVDFIDRHLDSRGQLAHRRQRVPFEALRDALFGFVYELLGSSGASNPWEDDSVRTFVGYAPVLEAISGYLDTDNFVKARQELETIRANYTVGTDHWKFLLRLVDDILRREREKFLKNVQSQLTAAVSAAGWSSWQVLYQADEQTSRVLARVLSSVPPPTPSELPAPLVAPYEDAVRENLDNHPFRGTRRGFANVVFAEYAYAWGLVRAPRELAEALRERLRNSRDNPYLPTPLLSRFLLAFTEGAKLDGRDLGFLLESLKSSGQPESVSLFVTGDTELATGMIVITPDSARREEELELVLDPSADGIHFWRTLANADIDVDTDVQVGSGPEPFQLGPKVSVSCGSLNARAREVIINPSGGVRIVVETIDSDTEKISVRHGSGRIAIYCPNATYPWVRYRTGDRPVPPPKVDPERWSVLWKLMLMFRGQLTRKENTVLRSRWSHREAPLRDELLALALSHKVFTKFESGRYGTVYRFNTAFGSLMTIFDERADFSPAAAKFISAFLGRDVVS